MQDFLKSVIISFVTIQRQIVALASDHEQFLLLSVPSVMQLTAVMLLENPTVWIEQDLVVKWWVSSVNSSGPRRRTLGTPVLKVVELELELEVLDA